MATPKNKLGLSAIIPFKDKASMTLDAIKSLLEYGPSIKEILLISNNSSTEELQKVQLFAQDYTNIQILEYNHPFNYQKMNNWAVEKSSGKFILFLNNDTELRPESKGLIERMVKKSTEKDVGIVGCLLLYGDASTIQHAGVFLVPGGLADHLYVGKKYSRVLARKDTSEFPYDITKNRPLTAVTGAVNIVERKKFDAVHGFDEKFIICGGDVDLCIRLNKSGYQTWYLADGFILHKESQSRSQKPIPYNDFYRSYTSYMQGYDTAVGDPFLPDITKKIKANA